MKDLITKVEELKDKFKSHYALEENAYGRACDDVIELLQNLQQTPCTTQLPADTWIEDDYCKCENPTLGTNLTRCGTCDCWFKPIA